MNLPDLVTLEYWNQLSRAHLPELVMVLTAALVALADRYVRRLVDKLTSSRGKAMRFAAFLVVCSAGYAVLALGLASLVRGGLAIERGAYMAPIAVGILFVVAIEAQRQRQV